MVQYKLLKDSPLYEIKAEEKSRPSVLLIDEVDVFFSDDFFNKVYVPILPLSKEPFLDLLDLAWMEREGIEKKYVMLKETDAFKNCQNLFRNEYQILMDNCLKDMIHELNSFMVDKHEYIVDKK